MTDAQFPADLIRRCEGEAAGAAGFRRSSRSTTRRKVVVAVLRESGHAELVAALKAALQYIPETIVSNPGGVSHPSDDARAALRKAGEVL